MNQAKEQILNRTNRNTDSIDALKYSLNNMKTEMREEHDPKQTKGYYTLKQFTKHEMVEYTNQLIEHFTSCEKRLRNATEYVNQFIISKNKI
jgi:hypothetical protein